MSDWLRWPRLWYATPTFVLFVALQAPDWRLTGRLCVALVVWAAAGVALDVWMTRHRQPTASATQQHMRRLINWHAILFVLGLAASLYSHVFGIAADSTAGMVATALNKVLQQLGILLPGLDIFHHKLLETGRLAYAAYLGSFFVLVVALWLPSLFLFYRTLANMPSAEFARLAEASPGLRKPPYSTKHRVGAWLRLVLGAVVLVAALLLFGRVLPMDAVQLRSGTYFTLAIAGTAINIFVYILHNYRRFLATLQRDGFLPLHDGPWDKRF